MRTEDVCWDWANEVLYQMCRNAPKHTDVNVTAGKLWLIGRAYSAQIERGAGGGAGAADSVYAKAASAIVNSQLDSWIESVADVATVDLTNLDRVLAVHSRFTALLRDHTGRGRRSFASKYLHFHNPSAFFIFDARAEAQVREETGKQSRFQLPSSCVEADQTYASFTLRMIEYRNRQGHGLTPRQLDDRLLGYR
jgi:hypothetical protein